MERGWWWRVWTCGGRLPDKTSRKASYKEWEQVWEEERRKRSQVCDVSSTAPRTGGIVNILLISWLWRFRTLPSSLSSLWIIQRTQQTLRNHHCQRYHHYEDWYRQHYTHSNHWQWRQYFAAQQCHLPNMNSNLLSAITLYDCGYEISMNSKKGVEILKDGKVVANAVR